MKKGLKTIGQLAVFLNLFIILPGICNDRNSLTFIALYAVISLIISVIIASKCDMFYKGGESN